MHLTKKAFKYGFDKKKNLLFKFFNYFFFAHAAKKIKAGKNSFGNLNSDFRNSFNLILIPQHALCFA